MDFNNVPRSPELIMNKETLYIVYIHTNYTILTILQEEYINNSK